MSHEALLKQLACGCCEVAAPPTPEEIGNRSGLTTIGYRIGTFSSFRQAMIEAIAASRVEVEGTHFHPLRKWTARASDDYGIAVLEMAAYLFDILTFYQEQYANEAYLRTAKLRESVMRLTALLDYKPAPGVAATVDLAFMLEKSKQVQIPVRLKVQSVPGQDEKPQKFETIEVIAADARLNRIRIFPKPQKSTALNQGSRQGVLDPMNAQAIVAALAPGDSLVVRLVGDIGVEEKRVEKDISVEEKRVEKVEVFDTHTILHWSPDILASSVGANLFKWRRKFRLFGFNAPETYIAPSVTANGTISFSSATVTFSQTESADLFLDSIYENLKAGTEVLVVAIKKDNASKVFAHRARIQNVSQASRRVVGFSEEGNPPVKEEKPPVMEATVTKLTLDPNVPAIEDIRQAVVYELVEPEITFWDREYAATISDSIIYVPLSQLQSLESGRTLILDDRQTRPQTVTVIGVDAESVPGHLAISFAPPLERPLDAQTAVLYGNIAQATHGETVAGEVLGNGDASTTFQSFQLRKSPVTFVPEPGQPHGAGNTLEIRVDGVLWHETPRLYGHGKAERIYTTSVDDENVMTVQYGDGLTGARLPSGRNNVVASYRRGLGRVGNVRANSLTNLLARSVGLKSVTNPSAAQGGADPESRDDIRINAPNSVRTFERVVSLDDFAHAARQFAGVAKASAIWAWDGLERVVHLTVAGVDGAAITGETMKTLVKDLNSRRDPHRKLVVESYQPVFVRVEATIQVDPDFIAEDVQAAVHQALLDYFAFDHLNLGQSIHLSNVYQALQAVKGVVSVDIDRLQFKNNQDRKKHGATKAAVQGHLRIFPSELAQIEQLDTDAVVKLRITPA